MRRDVIQIGVRLSREEADVLQKLLDRYGAAYLNSGKTFSGRFRNMLRKVGEQLLRLPVQAETERLPAEEEDGDDLPDWAREEEEPESEAPYEPDPEVVIVDGEPEL